MADLPPDAMLNQMKIRRGLRQVVDLRLQCLSLAVDSHPGVSQVELVNIARYYESYLNGEIEFTKVVEKSDEDGHLSNVVELVQK